MRRVAIITDSSACLPVDVGERYRIRLLPVTIHLSSATIRGDSEQAARLVYDALAREEAVKSSAPTMLEYLSAIEEAKADEVLVVTPATEFTVMWRNACIAAELAGGPVAVIDSRTAAAAHGLVAMAACRAAEAGAPLAEVVAAAEDASGRASLVAMLDGLEHLRRSGRVPSVMLEFGQHLGVRPVFRLRDGTVERVGLPRSEESALRRIVREARSGGLAPGGHSAVFHAAAPERAQRLRAMVGGAGFVTEFSPSMGIHTGPGVAGVAWLRPR